MKYVLHNKDKRFEFTTDLKFSIGAYCQRYDGIPRMKLVINFTEKTIDEDGNEVYLQTENFPFPCFCSFTFEIEENEMWIGIDEPSDFRLLVEAVERTGIEVKPI